MLGAIIIFIIAILFAFVITQLKYDFFKKRNIPFLKSPPLLGNYGRYILQREYISTVVEALCKRMPNEKMFGAFFGTEPVLIVQDPELIRQVTTKLFTYFSSREVYMHRDKEFTTRNLFFTYGDQWKVIRQNFSPLFSTSKMKSMFALIEKSSRKLEEVLDQEVSMCDTVDMQSLSDRYTIDIICACVFGVDTNMLERDYTNNPFTAVSHMIFQRSAFHWYKQTARGIWPTIFYSLGLAMYPKPVFRFFNGLLSQVFSEREKSGDNSRQDFIDLFLTLRKQEYIEGYSLSPRTTANNEKYRVKVDDEFLAAQCVVLFAAGFETSSATASFMLFELAKNPAAQIRAQEEVDNYMATHKVLDYDITTDVPYLLQCMDETLRLYPVLGVLARESTEDCDLLGGVHLPAGMRIHIPVRKIHRDPKNFEDPEAFNPDRFSPEKRKLIKPYTFLPFGEGPRICIGLRFAKMQVLSGVITILKKYSVTLAEGMPEEIPLQPRSQLTASLIPIMLKLIPRDNCRQRMYGGKA